MSTVFTTCGHCQTSLTGRLNAHRRYCNTTCRWRARLERQKVVRAWTKPKPKRAAELTEKEIKRALYRRQCLETSWI